MELAAAKLLRAELNAKPNGLSYLVGWDPKGSYYVFVDRDKVKEPWRIVVRSASGIGDGFDEAADEAMAVNREAWRIVHYPGRPWRPRPY